MPADASAGSEGVRSTCLQAATSGKGNKGSDDEVLGEDKELEDKEE